MWGAGEGGSPFFGASGADGMPELSGMGIPLLSETEKSIVADLRKNKDSRIFPGSLFFAECTPNIVGN